MDWNNHQFPDSEPHHARANRALVSTTAFATLGLINYSSDQTVYDQGETDRRLAPES